MKSAIKKGLEQFYVAGHAPCGGRSDGKALSLFLQKMRSPSSPLAGTFVTVGVPYKTEILRDGFRMDSIARFVFKCLRRADFFFLFSKLRDDASFVLTRHAKIRFSPILPNHSWNHLEMYAHSKLWVYISIF